MTPFHKIGPHGRTTNQIAGKRMRRALGLPQGVGFCVPVPRDLLISPAWLVVSGQCRKFVDALMAEHADHGGLENGKLKAPYDMLQARGMRRGTILDAITEAEALGIVDPTRGVRSYGSRKVPSVYRLTWLGTPDGLTPTHEWKAIKTDDEAKVRIQNAFDKLKKERANTAAARKEYPPSEQFSNPVHCVRLSNDALVYVCDRANDRIQVFRKDGTFVKEFRIEPETMQNGSVWDLVLSEDPEQKYIFIADGANGQIITINRDDGKVLTQWGRHGRQPGQFKWVHNIAIDSKGNIYTAEVGFGHRTQKFRRVE
jgi:hypothetical protein